MSFADNYAVSQTDARDGAHVMAMADLAAGHAGQGALSLPGDKNDGSPFSDQLKRFNYRHSNADVQADGPSLWLVSQLGGAWP